MAAVRRMAERLDIDLTKAEPVIAQLAAEIVADAKNIQPPWWGTREEQP
jgi:hypothetical protein